MHVLLQNTKQHCVCFFILPKLTYLKYLALLAHFHLDI